MFRKLSVCLLLLIAHASTAQFYKALAPSSEFADALSNIIMDFRYNFQNIMGEQIDADGSSDTYRSNIKLPGAEHCVINTYRSTEDTTANWQALMYRGDDFNEAQKAYSDIYKLIKRSTVKWADRSTYRFSGKFEKPSENVRFAISTLDLEINDRRYDYFKAEIELVSGYAGWEVRLNFHNKKNDYERYANTGE